MNKKTLISGLKVIIGRRDSNINDVEDEEKDVIEKCIGVGLYQVIVSAVISISSFIAVWNFSALIFVAPKTDFTCVLWEESSNITNEVNISTCYDNCLQYHYQEKVFEKNLISSFHLICDRDWLNDFMYVLIYFGATVGYLIFGWLADRKGRRNALRLAFLYNSVILLPTVFCPNIWIFIILQCISRAISAGTFVTSTVYIFEISGTKYRAAAVSWLIFTNGIGLAIFTVFARYSSTWDIFMMKYGIVSALLLAVVLWLPDTPRWLVANQRTERAVEVITRAAAWNKRDITIVDEEIKKKVELIRVHLTTNKIKYLFNDRTTISRTICLLFSFLQIGIELVYINSRTMYKLNPDPYFRTLALSFLMIASGLISAILSHFFSRRGLLIGSYLVTSVCIILESTIPGIHLILIYISNAITVCSITISLITCSIIVAELYPTSLRGTISGLTFASLFLGFLLSSVLEYVIQDLVRSMILVVLSITAAIVTLLLPETKGKQLIDTLQNIETEVPT